MASLIRTFLAKGFYLPAIYHNITARVENQEKVGEEGDQVAPESFNVHQLSVHVVRRNRQNHVNKCVQVLIPKSLASYFGIRPNLNIGF